MCDGKPFDRWSSTAQRNCLIWFDDFPSIHSINTVSVSPIVTLVSELSPSISDSNTKSHRCLAKGKLQGVQKITSTEYLFTTMISTLFHCSFQEDLSVVSIYSHLAFQTLEGDVCLQLDLFQLLHTGSQQSSSSVSLSRISKNPRYMSSKQSL